MGLSGFRGIGFRIPLRGLSGVRVTPGLVVPTHPLPIPVCWYFEFSLSFVFGFKYIGLIVLWCHIGWFFVESFARFLFPYSQNMWTLFFRILSLTQSNLMSVVLDLFCVVVPFTMLFFNVFSIDTGVGGCEWPNFARAARMDVVFWKISDNPPNSASLDDSMIFLMMLHSTCTGIFSGEIGFIGVLDFVPRKKYPPALLCASGYEM